MPAALVDIADFSGDIAVGQKGGVEVQAALRWYIDEYTPLFLRKLLTAPVAEAFASGLAAGEPDAVALAASLRPACARFIWCEYTLGRSSFATGTGEVYLLGENSERADYSPKVARNWNRMADLVREASADIRAYRRAHAPQDAPARGVYAPGVYGPGCGHRGLYADMGGLADYTTTLI